MGAEDKSQVQQPGGAEQPPPGTQQAPMPPPGMGMPQPPPQQQAAGAKAKVTEEPDSAPPVFDKDDMLHLPKREFLKKAAKHSRKILRAAFGTADLDELKKLKGQWDEWDAKEQERRRADLSAQEKLAEDVEAQRQRADQAERRMLRAKQRVRIHKVERRTASVAQQHVDPAMTDVAVALFAQHVKKLGRKARKLDDAAVSQWFQDLAAKNAKFAREGGEAPQEQRSHLPRPPMSNGTPPRKEDKKALTPNSKDLFHGKTPRPGQPNSMNDEEVKQYARQNNLPWAT